MPLGKKVFDVYGELHLDKDEVRQGLRGLAGEMGPEADRAGQDLGKRMSEGLAKSVEQSSARVTRARRAEVDAANAVKVAELRLNEAREKGKAPASQMLALENSLEKAHYRLAQAQSNTVTSTKKLEDAQRLLAKSLGDGVDKDLGPRMQRSGDDAGGKLAMGMRMSVIRNSPLIVAAVGAALIAGGPAMLTAATGLFAGIGIVAAAQSLRVQQAWRGTWQQIKDGATASAAPIEDVLVRVAANVSTAFQRMQPQIASAFSASAPQIAVFSGGITRLAENALPGLVRAVQAGMPVTQGFADFLAKTGTGLSDFFDRITAHAPAAGKVWSQLGDTMGTLLPTLGELIGQGAELGAQVLPLLNGTLGILLKVTTALGPALPVIVAGFAAMKIARSVTGWVSGLGGALDSFAAKTNTTSLAGGRLGTTLSTIGAAAPLVGIGIGLIGAAFSRGQQEIDAFGTRVQGAFERLRSGGAAAADARRELDFLRDAASKLPSGALSDEISKQEAAYHRLWNAMGPVEQAQSKVAEWTATLASRLDDENASSGDVEAAKRRLAYWADQEAAAQDRVKAATEGVTQALADQANQARSRVDAGFAYEQSILQVKEAQDKLNEVMADPKSKPSQVEAAVLALNRAYEGTVTAAGDIARSNLPASMDDTQKSILGAKGELDRLNQLIAEGVKLPDSMEQYRRQLEQITGQADGAKLAQAQLAGAIGELGFAVKAVPNAKAVTITAPTDAVKAKLAELGFTITAIPGSKDVKVEAKTDEAKAHLGDLSTQLAGLNTTAATPTVTVDPNPAQSSIAALRGALGVLAAERPEPIANLATGPFDAYWQHAMNNIGILTGQRPTPVAQLNKGPFDAGFYASLGQIAQLGAQRPSPVATLYANTGAAEAAINYAARNRTAYITTLYNTSNARGMALGGKVGEAVRRFDVGGSPSRRADGRISGPGGPLDDLVPAVTNMGEHIRVANSEWIVPGFVASMQGEQKMSAFTAGRADIVPRQQSRRFADGGTPNPTTGTGQMNRSQVTVENLNVTFSGGDLSTDRQSMRKAALMLREELVKLERADS